MAGIALVIGAALIGLVFFLPVIRPIIDTEADPPGISILPPFRQEPKVIPQEELVEYMLQLINKDRASFGLEPVKLGSNAAAQIHAEDVYRNKQISHWMSNGEKPYITYSKYGGVGSVGQNVAIAGFSREQYDLCMKSTRYNCEVIDPLVTLKELQYEMMYNDTECCDDGHRNNILNKFRTDVSIGIVYDKYYLALVQNFENNYGIDIDINGGSAEISGVLGEGTIDQIAIYYDVTPTPEIYEQNKRLLSYSGGELVAAVVKPLPLGFFYEQPSEYKLLVAREWNVDGSAFDISFDLAKAVGVDGVYTVSVIAKTHGDSEVFEAASYSMFVDMESEID